MVSSLALMSNTIFVLDAFPIFAPLVRSQDQNGLGVAASHQGSLFHVCSDFVERIIEPAIDLLSKDCRRGLGYEAAAGCDWPLLSRRHSPALRSSDVSEASHRLETWTCWKS